MKRSIDQMSLDQSEGATLSERETKLRRQENAPPAPPRLDNFLLEIVQIGGQVRSMPFGSFSGPSTCLLPENYPLVLISDSFFLLDFKTCIFFIPGVFREESEGLVASILSSILHFGCPPFVLIIVTPDSQYAIHAWAQSRAFVKTFMEQPACFFVADIQREVARSLQVESDGWPGMLFDRQLVQLQRVKAQSSNEALAWFLEMRNRLTAHIA